MLSAVILSEFRVRSEINLHFQVLRRLPGKAPKHRNIEIFLCFGNAARQDASAHKNANLFLREPLATQQCRWCDNWNTICSFIPVLSY
jgi:hypothetical protein